MKQIDLLREKLVGEILIEEEIDRELETQKFLPDERDEDAEEGILKYTNGKSGIWVKYTRDETGYLVEQVTRCTKKEGSTKVRAFHTFDEIRGMLLYFRDNERYDEVLIFVLGCLLARRIGDTLSLKWSDFYHENGARKNTLSTLVEEKTDKIVRIKITNVAWQYIDWYCHEKQINPMEHLREDIFLTDAKREALVCANPTERKEKYKKAIISLSAAYRYRFQQAAEYNHIEGVSTHSTRKTFGYIAHMYNKHDPDHLLALQAIFGHDSIETTKIYIDTIDDKANKIFDDVSVALLNAEHGCALSIDNRPVVELRTEDLRDILAKAYMAGKESDDSTSEIETMNKLISMVEEKCISW